MKGRYSVIVLSFLIALVLGGCGTVPKQEASVSVQAPVQEKKDQTVKEAQAWYEKGQQAYHEFRLEDTIDCCSKAIEKDPNMALAYSTRGAAKALAGKAQDGLSDSEKAVSLAPDLAQVYYDRALVYKVLHRYEEAIADFKRVLGYDKNNTWSYYGIASIYGDLGNAPLAVQYLSEAVRCGGTEVKEAARTQSHFDSIRQDFKFQELIKE